ncbi:hypothetical protein J4216_00300 [Candidatus Woesearchaeota archaeon]|nr:hypothetical protein [Candidatus Woesearchaeota archaeon]
MIPNFIAFLGTILGYFIADKTQDELSDGKIYFKIFELIILLILIILFLINGFVWWLFLIGVIFGFFLRYEYLYFGFLNNLLGLFLVFLYGLPYGSLLYMEKKWKYIFYSLVFFIIGFFINFLGFNLINFGLGGLVTLFLIKSYYFSRTYIF